MLDVGKCGCHIARNFKPQVTKNRPMSDKASLFSRLAQVATNIFTRRYGVQVGTDSLGNRYFRDKRGNSPRAFDARLYKEGRWVIYAGEPEASKVPPEWHAWLHHQSNIVPAAENPLRRNWQLPPQQNLTGTEGAYLPPGHAYRGARRDAATGDYEAWVPE
jgi:NADH:ubiquinone oxidoreductase subunit